jgi:CRP-like cAMP-binding protein
MSQPAQDPRRLSPADLDAIRRHTETLHYQPADTVFAEGDAADFIYFVVSGQVEVFLQKFTTRQALCTLAPGDYFGEMAVLNGGKRSASVVATEPTTLLRADRIAFHRLLDEQPQLSAGIFSVLDQRNQLTAVQELILDGTSNEEHFQFSIKGDPSLRESVFSRERYDSVVDKLLEPLCPQIEDLLINRCEISTASIFDPFCEVVHAAYKLADPGYVERQFARIDYADKLAAVRAQYDQIRQSAAFDALPARFHELQSHLTLTQGALTPDEIRSTVSRLPLLRKISNLYIRNIKINVVRHAIRMQFNCDGTHFVSAADYLRFLEENLPAD